MTVGGYRRHLQVAVAASAAPYGFTLTIWTSGAITTHAEGGSPSAADAVLLLSGAVCGFLVVGTVAYGGVHSLLAPGPPTQVRVWGGAHLPSVGLSIGVVAILCVLLADHVLWLAVGFCSTTSYLTVIGLQFWAATRRTPAPLLRQETDP
ncbi:MAG TPA: hypothetical protein DEQ43_07655 [Nocardioides bacterium]|uniref:hypothetical protein n=1 Tax=uncultured Nocardioides sp. TaxID=198441 RepID=UPI000EED5A43|nr:hypothetical protein [uncultured Nocardioides sp.]HCB04108.1 hypothetical protein [Nocardioides sp.]